MRRRHRRRIALLGLLYVGFALYVVLDVTMRDGSALYGATGLASLGTSLVVAWRWDRR